MGYIGDVPKYQEDVSLVLCRMRRMQLAYIHHHHTQVKSREDGYVSLGSNLNLVSNLANCITSSTTTTLEILPRLKLELWMVNTTYKCLMIRTSRTPEACVAHSVMLSRCRLEQRVWRR